ncbi:MAG: hypothetical protein IJG52_02630 [Lachnospiraceae bacterium]|nr:hypothetical protein [Lachnospiraceae bacterium]
MTVKELKAFFKDHLVPAKLYHLDGSRSGKLCLTRDGNEWEVFFREKKEKIGLMKFATENEACVRMMDEVRKVMEQIYGMTWKGLA